MQNSSVPKIAFSIPEAAQAASISRSQIYKELSAGRLLTFHVGTRRLVSLTALEQFIKDRESEAVKGAA